MVQTACTTPLESVTARLVSTEPPPIGTANTTDTPAMTRAELSIT